MSNWLYADYLLSSVAGCSLPFFGSTNSARDEPSPLLGQARLFGETGAERVQQQAYR